MARLGEKALPFYSLMKKLDKKFEWTEEADQAFAHLKKVRTKRKRTFIDIHCSHTSGGKYGTGSRT
jgi:hypothetical protein